MKAKEFYDICKNLKKTLPIGFVVTIRTNEKFTKKSYFALSKLAHSDESAEGCDLFIEPFKV